MRGLAALAVVMLHAGTVEHSRGLAPHGYLAVDFFFVLSGFVLAHAYGDRLETRSLDWPRFCRIRLNRLVPIAMLGVALGATLAIADPVARNGIASLSDIVIATAFGLFMLPSPVSPFYFPLNPPLWSVSAEIGANVGWSIGAPLLRGWRLPALVSAAAVWTVIELGLAGHVSDASRVVYGFFAGVLVYRAPRAPRSLRYAAAVAAVGSMVWFFLPSSPEPWTMAIARLVAFPLVIWLGASIELEGALRRAAELSGEISYPLYALHGPIIVVTLRHGVPTVLAIAASILAAIGASRLYDRPVRNARTRGSRLAERERGGGETATQVGAVDAL